MAAYVSRAGFSLLQCSATQAMLATPGFFLRHSLHPLLLPEHINHA